MSASSLPRTYGSCARGRRDNPTHKHLFRAGRLLRRLPNYFFKQAEADRDAVPPELAAALKNNDVRDMALRAAGLSDRALRAIRDMVENARTVEGLAYARPWNLTGCLAGSFSWRGVMHTLGQAG